MKLFTSLAAFAVLAASVFAQSKPVDIPKDKLPASAECVVCAKGGHAHKGKPAAGVRFEGAAYYFCHASEVPTFKANPTRFTPQKAEKPASRPMPTFDLVDTKGKRWNAGSFKNRVVLIDYWATWCGPCKRMKPVLDEIQKAYKSRGLNVLAVSVDENRADLNKYLQSNKTSATVIHDNKGVAQKWGVRSIPALFLVKDGRIVNSWVGVTPKAEIEAAVQAALRN